MSLLPLVLMLPSTLAAFVAQEVGQQARRAGL